jgi:TonB family protein
MDIDTIDPRAVKIMSDILALTIDEQDGVALSALSRIRRRARESAVTGGGLKETFRRLVHISGMVSSEELDHASSLGGPGAAPAMVGRLTSQVDALRSQLAYAEQLRLQDAADFVRRRRRDVFGGVGYGVMIGAATMVLAAVAVWATFPSVRHPPHRLVAALDFRSAVPEMLAVQDYPADAARRGDQGMVTLALSIGPQGEVTAAQLARSSGSTELDEAALAMGLELALPAGGGRWPADRQHAHDPTSLRSGAGRPWKYCEWPVGWRRKHGRVAFASLICNLRERKRGRQGSAGRVRHGT